MAAARRGWWSGRAVLAVSVALLACSPALAATRRMFITSGDSGIHGADLGGWLHALNGSTGVTGSAAADAICQYFAGQSSLGLPAANFRAWISTSTDDAYCRILLDADHAGKRDPDFCGFATEDLLDAATNGPWLRTDGYPFSFDLARLIQGGGALTPALYDENGTAVSVYVNPWTGSNTQGASGLNVGNCDDWTDSANDQNGTVGRLMFTTSLWQTGASAVCGSGHPLLCFDTKPSDPLPPFEAPGALVFVSTTSGSGKLSTWPGAQGTGIDAGDSICRKEAIAAGLPNPTTFFAWLSDAGRDVADRIVTDGPWKRFDGAQVAASKADLLDGRLFTAIGETLAGTYLDFAVFTGTKPDGTAWGADCQGWTSGLNTDLVAGGGSGMIIDGWTVDSGSYTCDGNARIYCFSQSIVDYWDSFETGGLGRWSGKS